jgi:AefR-like transcriptional repressor, C-terminal domain
VCGAPHLLAKMRTTVKRNSALIAAQLARYFENQIAEGRLRELNVDYAAEQFLSSILGFARIEIMMGVTPKMHDRPAYIRATVDSFLDGVQKGRQADG